jgi:hypothetical protein
MKVNLLTKLKVGPGVWLGPGEVELSDADAKNLPAGTFEAHAAKPAPVAHVAPKATKEKL